MVYCDYIKNDADSVEYAFGALASDITGQLVFYFRQDEIKIIVPPKGEMAPKRHIERLYRIEKKNFLNGVFHKKISYESS